jgi:adenylate cyclase class IV
MDFQPAEYEVEFRCHFDGPEDAYRALPFLRACLTRRVPWSGTYYGLELFRSGKVLRISEVSEDQKTRYYIAWKGPDTGKFCNIRREMEEIIGEDTAVSPIMQMLRGKADLKSKDEVIRELEGLGYHPFMSWSGVDSLGYYEPYDIKVKLMSCPLLKYPWLVEMEKMAATEEEARRCENELYEISQKLNLKERIFKEEPPQLLYEKVFGPGAV